MMGTVKLTFCGYSVICLCRAWARSAALQCTEGAVSWKIVMSCMRHVTDAYAGMIMTGTLHRDTLMTSLADSCSLSWPGFVDCAKEKLLACNLDDDLAYKLHQSSMCQGNRPKDFILDLVSSLPEEVDVSCVTQTNGGSFQPCVAQLFGAKRPESLFLDKSRAIMAKRYVGFIKCAVELVGSSTCDRKEVMATVFTVFGLTTAPSSVQVTKQDLESIGIMIEDGETNATTMRSNRT